jgi:sigma-B regulation protein RsbU (phosphoserine phosphatase)
LLLASSGQVKVRLESTGTVLGLTPDASFPTAPTIALEPGDVLVFVTDGILEAVSPDQSLFGVERTLAVVRDHLSRGAQEIADALCRSASDFYQGAAQGDDLTAVILKVIA